MYKLLTHPYAQCGFDGYSSNDSTITFYSYNAPIYKIRKVTSPYNDICATITTIAAPVHSVTTARHTTWSLYEQLHNFDVARFVRRMMKKLDSDTFITVWYNISDGVWCVFIGIELIRTFYA